MNETDKNRLVITKLIQETQKDTIIWNSFPDKRITLPHDGEIIDKVYTSIFKGKHFRLFRYRHKDYSSDFDTLYWSSSIKLEITDKDGFSEWEFPYDNSLNDLYEAVRYKVSGFNEFINELLGLEIIKAVYGSNRKSIDITFQLSELIENDKLKFTVNNTIAGDPDIGVVKILKIKYSVNGVVYDKEFKEDQEVNIP
jgi:hypothetical protein